MATRKNLYVAAFSVLLASGAALANPTNTADDADEQSEHEQGQRQRQDERRLPHARRGTAAAHQFLDQIPGDRERKKDVGWVDRRPTCAG